MVRRHQRNVGGSMTHHFGWWDWCAANPGWAVIESTSSSWRDKYARNAGGGLAGELYAYSEVIADNPEAPNCWSGYLYNFSTGTWDLKLRSCGTTKTGWGLNGWTMWESYGLTTQGICPNFPRIRTTSIQVFTLAGWKFLSPALSSPLDVTDGCFDTGDYTFHTHVANWEWEAHTP